MTLSRSHGQAAWIRTVVFVSVLCVGVQAQEFAGGAGTPEDPYQIATAEQFRQMGVWSWKSSDAHFVLVADIDCSGMDRGPFSNSSDTFDAVLDGNFYTLRNLAIAPGGTAQAIFPIVGSRGIVRNLVVENCRTYARSDSAVGVLCGTNVGQVLNCRANDCVVSVEGQCDTGILAGINRGLVEDCRAHAVTVISFYSSSSGGGLVGRNLGVMRCCAAEGSVFGSGNLGGLAGTNAGAIEACWAQAVVTVQAGGQVSAGLVGVNQGRITDCYAAGSVWGGKWQGGLVGRQQIGTIVRCYSTAPVFSSWSQETGPLIGEGDAGSVHSCYYLSDDGSTYAADTPGIGLSFADMMRRENYADWAFFDEDPNQAWLMAGSGLPRLAWEFEQDIPVVAGRDVNEARQVLGQHGWQIGEIRSDYSRQVPAERVIWTFPSRRATPGTPIDIVVSQGTFDWSAMATDPNVGTAACPLRIQTAGQLEALRDWDQSENKHIELVAHIDMAGRTLSESLLGTMRAVPCHGAEGTGFAGSLQGNGFEISNLTIRASSGTMYPGLVGYLSESGCIMNLVLTRAAVSGFSSYGGQTGGALVGRNEGTTRRCHARDSVCTGVAAGLVGSNEGTIEQCSNVSGIVYAGCAGGLVQSNKGTVDQCFSDVCVGTGGGLVWENAGRLTNSYARGIILGRGGTLAAYNGGDMSCCYAAGWTINDQGAMGMKIVDTDTGRSTDCYYRVYQLPLGYGASSGTAGTPLFSDVRMRQPFSFRAWDFWGVQTDGFGDVWFLPADGYPILTWQYGLGDLPAVPSVLGLYVYHALSRLQSTGIAAAARYEFDDRVPVSHVIRTEVGGAPGDETFVTVVASLGPCDWANNRGDGSAANPFTISLASQLFSLANHAELWGRHFVLSADLDLGWTPLDRALIAGDPNMGGVDPNTLPDPNIVGAPDVVGAGFQGPCFNGTFDGAGHTLANLTITSGGSYLGLFGALGPDARIARLHVDNVLIAGTAQSRYVGPIAGLSTGALEDCHTSGWIGGGGYVGALAGYITGTTAGCTSTVEGSWGPRGRIP
jgi:hypothetical protein